MKERRRGSRAPFGRGHESAEAGMNGSVFVAEALGVLGPPVEPRLGFRA